MWLVPAIGEKLMMRFAVVAASFWVATLTAQHAVAAEDADATSCLTYDMMASYLDRAFDEGRVAVGELENGHTVEMFASRSGTWTLIEIMPNGNGCIRASGTRMKVERLNRRPIAAAG